jgi:hypothetical protein
VNDFVTAPAVRILISPPPNLIFGERQNRSDDVQTDERIQHIQACMYQYSRAMYRSLRELIDPYVSYEVRLEYRRALLWECEQTLSRLAKDPQYFSKPDRALFQDIRRYFPITAQAEVAWVRKASAQLSASSRSSSRPAPSTAVSPVAGHRYARKALPAPAAGARLLPVAQHLNAARRGLAARQRPGARR